MTAFIFTAMMGAGPVIAIGVIVLPILMSLGIPKAIAMFTFMGSVSAGMYLNPVLQFSQLRAFICASDEMPEFSFSWYTSHWGIYALIISVVVVSVLTGIYLKIGKKSHAWAAQAAPKNTQTDAPLIDPDPAHRSRRSEDLARLLRYRRLRHRWFRCPVPLRQDEQIFQRELPAGQQAVL